MTANLAKTRLSVKFRGGKTLRLRSPQGAFSACREWLGLFLGKKWEKKLKPLHNDIICRCRAVKMQYMKNMTAPKGQKHIN